MSCSLHVSVIKHDNILGEQKVKKSLGLTKTTQLHKFSNSFIFEAPPNKASVFGSESTLARGMKA